MSFRIPSFQVSEIGSFRVFGFSRCPARKKFAVVRDVVGNFIGSDIIRALVSLAEPNTHLYLVLLESAVLEVCRFALVGYPAISANTGAVES